MKFLPLLTTILIITVVFYNCSTNKLDLNDIKEEIAVHKKQSSFTFLTEDLITLSVEQSIKLAKTDRQKKKLKKELRKLKRILKNDMCPSDACTSCCFDPPCIPANCNEEMIIQSMSPSRIITHYEIHPINEVTPINAKVTRIPNSKTAVKISAVDINPKKIDKIRIILADKKNYVIHAPPS